MLQKLRNDSKGFTLIELMIVIAIIGILAAIAIPNFIAYRNKAFCSAAESDANNIAAVLADYYAVPSRTAFQGGDPTAWLNVELSGNNTATLGGNVDSITISVTDRSGRCPDDYQNAQADWNATTNIFEKNM